MTFQFRYLFIYIYILIFKRVLCLSHTLLHERDFLHYFHLNQITSVQNLIRVSFMQQLNHLKIQSTLHNIGDTYLKRFLVNVFQMSAATQSQKQRSKLHGIMKVITAITIIIIILLVIVIFIIIGTVIIIIIFRYCYY